MATNRDRGSVRSHLLARFPLIFISFHWFSYISNIQRYAQMFLHISAASLQLSCSLLATSLQSPCRWGLNHRLFPMVAVARIAGCSLVARTASSHSTNCPLIPLVVHICPHICIPHLLLHGTDSATILLLSVLYETDVAVRWMFGRCSIDVR